MSELVARIQKMMRQNKWSLALAESCTGGQLAAELTRQPGASHCFFGGVVVYSNEAKEKVLGVSAQALKEHGAVSEVVALQMAQGVKKLYDSDWSVSVTGVAGPDGGSPEKPVGTVWFSWTGPNFEKTQREVFDGEREDVQRASVLLALEVLWNAMKSDRT